MIQWTIDRLGLIGYCPPGASPGNGQLPAMATRAVTPLVPAYRPATLACASVIAA